MLQENRPIILLLSIIAVVAVGVVLLVLRTVLLPFAAAAFLAFLFKPLVVILKKKGVPTAISLIAVLLVVAILLAALGGILYSTISAFIESLPRYEARVTGLVVGVLNWATAFAEKWGVELDEYFSSAAIDITTLTSALQTGLSSFVGFFGNVLIVLLFLMFMLAGTGNMSTKVARAFSTDRATKVAGILENIDSQIREYLLAKTLVSLITGVITAIICLLFGVDFAFLWGFVAFLLNFIPTFGSIIATVAPAFIAVLQFESLLTPILLLAALLATQFTMGNVVEPRLMGIRLNLSPLAILFSIILWAWLWGPWGMIIAVPITASLKIVFENIESLKPISVLMSGVPRSEIDGTLKGGHSEASSSMMREASE
jgi:predicted PurR-regulated permease PerM